MAYFFSWVTVQQPVRQNPDFTQLYYITTVIGCRRISATYRQKTSKQKLTKR